MKRAFAIMPDVTCDLNHKYQKDYDINVHRFKNHFDRHCLDCGGVAFAFTC